MCHSVIVQVRTGRKRFAANWTRVRPLAAVYALVGVQRAGCGERFVALYASVWTLSCEQPRGKKYNLDLSISSILTINKVAGM